MGFFSRRKVELKEEEKTGIVNKLTNGWKTDVTLPEVESVEHGMVTKGVATGVFGLVGLAMTMGSSTKQRKIRTIVRIPEKGIVIENGTVDGKDIKLPWESIINATNAGGIIVDVHLVEGETIRLFFHYPIKNHEISDFITGFINDHAAGQVEDGW